MRKAGVKAFAARSETRSGVYAYEQNHDGLSKTSSPREAWYRKKASWWVMSAKKEETRRARLARLVAASARGVEL